MRSALALLLLVAFAGCVEPGSEPWARDCTLSGASREYTFDGGYNITRGTQVLVAMGFHDPYGDQDSMFFGGDSKELLVRAAPRNYSEYGQPDADWTLRLIEPGLQAVDDQDTRQIEERRQASNETIAQRAQAFMPDFEKRYGRSPVRFRDVAAGLGCE